MKYYYEKPTSWFYTQAIIAAFDHPLYNKATLYLRDNKGLVIIQQRFNAQTKVMWWGPIDPWLVDDLANQDNWKKWFDQNAKEKDKDGLYPTFTIREVMWAMRMKPLKREIFEGHIKWR